MLAATVKAGMFFLRVDPSDIVLRNIEVDSEDGAGVRVQMN
jgi:hypothetical protein